MQRTSILFPAEVPWINGACQDAVACLSRCLPAWNCAVADLYAIAPPFGYP
jgi:hypothetical protein